MHDWLKRKREFKAKRDLSFHPGQVSHLQMAPPKTRDRSGRPNVTQLKYETVHGRTMKRLGCGVRQTTNSRAVIYLLCDFEESTSLPQVSGPLFTKWKLVTVPGME